MGFASLIRKIRPIRNRIPEYHHFEEQPWIGLHNSRQNRWPQWPGSIRRSSKQSVFHAGNGPSSVSFHVPPDWHFFLKWELWMILFSAEAILASSTSKFGIWIPLIDDEDIKSSTESTISTSLIHSMASVGNCEQGTYLSFWILSSNKQMLLEQGICQSEVPKFAVFVGLHHNPLKIFPP